MLRAAFNLTVTNEDGDECRGVTQEAKGIAIGFFKWESLDALSIQPQGTTFYGISLNEAYTIFKN